MNLGGAGMRPPHFQQTKKFGADKSPNIAMTCEKSFETYLYIYIYRYRNLSVQDWLDGKLRSIYQNDRHDEEALSR